MAITRETLELAAKAAGYDITALISGTIVLREKVASHLTSTRYWNPEHDDGDSARLRTDCRITSAIGLRSIKAFAGGDFCVTLFSDHNNDKHAALRYATLMVAAEIGRRMK